MLASHSKAEGDRTGARRALHVRSPIQLSAVAIVSDFRCIARRASPTIIATNLYTFLRYDPTNTAALLELNRCHHRNGKWVIFIRLRPKAWDYVSNWVTNAGSHVLSELKVTKISLFFISTASMCSISISVVVMAHHQLIDSFWRLVGGHQRPWNPSRLPLWLFFGHFISQISKARLPRRTSIEA